MNEVDAIIAQALAEDIHTGDMTTKAILSSSRGMRAQMVAKEGMVLAGIGIAERVFTMVDPESVFTAPASDGAAVRKGDLVAEIYGDAAALLQAERVALNLLQRMCGIASQTALFVEEIAGTGARIVDTRKTTPGLRVLEKYAVRVGGGGNHRAGLYDGVLIKENHIASVGGIRTAIERARAYVPHTLKIEVETETIEEVEQAVRAGADIILLDNMTLEQMVEAVGIIGKRALVEASGGVNLQNVRSIAETGVDLISVGALTHSVRSMDISMRMQDL